MRGRGDTAGMGLKGEEILGKRIVEKIMKRERIDCMIVKEGKKSRRNGRRRGRERRNRKSNWKKKRYNKIKINFLNNIILII